ncbi:MAG: hypothetical protein CMC96_01785 [Flavobacteriales bacterium]|nr:hypothetical protein [Flavobacteriales bacterium]|tara:strand:+ start:33453 stop:33845 length:393 start_codon:yes stop_codon:yes gene_type:complete
METLNSQQLIEIAKQLKVIARSINDFQIDNWNNLTTEQFNRLNKTERDILLTVQDLIARSVTVLAENSEDLISMIKEATDKVETSLKQIENINKAIEIATASVFIASAIISQNPSAISLSLQGLAEALEE